MMKSHQSLPSTKVSGRRSIKSCTVSGRRHRNLRVKVYATATLEPTEQTVAKPQAHVPVVAGPPICIPEDLQLASGELSKIDRVGRNNPDDVYRCVGCTKTECQVRPLKIRLKCRLLCMVFPAGMGMAFVTTVTMHHNHAMLSFGQRMGRDVKIYQAKFSTQHGPCFIRL